MSTEESIGVVIGVVVLLVAARELFCWYFKINERNELLREQTEVLKKTLEKEKEEKKE